MLKVGVKRRRTQAQIKDDKEDIILQEMQQQEAMGELANLRARVQEAEQQATTNKAAAELMSQLIVAGHVIQEADEQVVINAKDGVQRPY